VALFADRAEAMVPGFTLTAANQQPVVQLCRRLDGIPLALELAAVRLRAMSIEQIVARLDDRFLLLGTARSSDDRHQTSSGSPHEPSSPPGSAARTQTEMPCSCSRAT
jgi:predicted ATPase